MTPGKVTVVAALGTTQTLAWASSYYLPAVLGVPIARALDLQPSVFFAVFSGALLLSAVVAPYVGRLIDGGGGRAILIGSNLVLAAGLALLGMVQGVVGLAVAWAALGIGIAMGLYDAAFATLTRLYGREARSAITGITLIAGFASTVGWPVSAWLDHEFGWRTACFVWAAVNLGAALPLNWLILPQAPPIMPIGTPSRHGFEAEDPPRWAMPILVVFFCATAFVTGALQAHLLRFLELVGASETGAILAGALVGPTQVAARLVEFGLLRSLHPVWSARLAVMLHPLGAVLLAAGSPGILVFALAYGAGNGMITIAKGTLPLAIFGPAGYGLRTGLLAAPARLAQSAAPLLFALLLDRFGMAAVLLTVGLNLAAFAALWLLRPAPVPTAVSAGN